MPLSAAEHDRALSTKTFLINTWAQLIVLAVPIAGLIASMNTRITVNEVKVEALSKNQQILTESQRELTKISNELTKSVIIMQRDEEHRTKLDNGK